MDRRKFLESNLILGTLVFCQNNRAWGKASDSAAKALLRINEIANDLKLRKLDQGTWKVFQENALASIDLKEMLKYVDLNKIESSTPIFDRNRMKFYKVDFTSVFGTKAKIMPNLNLFASYGGGGILPHGHNNVCSSHFVLKGQFRVRHWERYRDTKKELFLSQNPTVDKTVAPGQFSSITDHSSNVHHLVALNKTPCFLLNIHNKEIDDSRGESKVEKAESTLKTPYWKRVYCDVEGGKIVEDGTRCVPILSFEQALKKYG